MLQRIVGFLTVSSIAASAFAAPPVKELTPKYDRTKSLTMIRSISRATVANLDYAAYVANPVRSDPKMQKPKAPATKPGLADLTFGGVLTSITDDLSATPLSQDEKDAPMAWRPLVDRLWKVVKHPGFVEISGAVEGNKWNDPNVTKPYQEIVVAYLHGEGENTELWVRVDFAPWVKFLQGVNDEDKDGYPEIYGKVVLDKIDPAVQAKAFEYIRTDYAARVLNKEEFTDWITTLASYWYPTYNTDVIDMAGETVWPNKYTEPKVVKSLKGLKFENPTAVIRGKPFSTKIYNIYLVEGLGGEAEKVAETEPAKVVINKILDTALSKSWQATSERLASELKVVGSYDAWGKKNAPYIQAQKDFLAKLPAGQLGFQGKDNWLFFGKSLAYTSGGDLNKQAQDKNPIPHLVELKKFLNQQDISLIFVPVPNKEEVYFEQLPFKSPAQRDAILNPYSRKFIKDAKDAGIEVIDLLPAFLAAKAEDAKHKEKVYQLHDTHWSNRGLQIAASMISDRIKEYSWYPDAAKSAVHYTVKDTTFMRKGDIVERLPQVEQANFPEVELQAQRVYTKDGKPYQGDRTSPLMLIGDSFTGVYESVDCKSAGVGAHIAAKTGLPVDIITSWGGGPLVRERMMRARKNDFGSKRVVIYMMVARDLYNYDQGWAPLKIE